VDPILRLQIEHECARLIKVYCNSIDSHDVERLLGVFAKDGEWQRPGNPPLKGRAEIREFVEHHGVGAVSAHYVTNIVVDVDDQDHASSNAYALVFRGSGTADSGPLPLSLPRLVVHYQHKFIRENGQWYIKRKETRWLFQREGD
jgi:nuclear transport factor 2 (NTF2) superfamily protein